MTTLVLRVNFTSAMANGLCFRLHLEWLKTIMKTTEFNHRGCTSIVPESKRPANATSRKTSPIRGWPLWILPVVLSGCATYHAVPLPSAADLTRTPPLEVPVKALQVPGLKPQPFKAAHGLNMTAVVTLAVVNNPQLKAARMRAGVADAQLLQAGLLPNPQFSPAFLHPTGGPPPIGNGYSVGLSQDLTALITRSAARAQARARRGEVNLQILWQEWQVAQRARQLFISARSQAHLSRILQTQRRLLASRYRRDRKALKDGNLALSTVAADLVGLVNAETRLRKLQRQRNTTWHQLDGLLGLQPGVEPKLAGSVHLAAFSAEAYKTAIAALPDRRPDLLALRLGYHSQEAAVREAILKQFPSLRVGLNQGRDTGKVRSLGFSVSLSLPLFNHNQGNIAIARATRALLRQTYQERLDQAVNHAHELWSATQIMSRQLKTLRNQLPILRQTTAAARRSFQHGDMSAGTYVSLRSSLLAKRAEVVQLRASLHRTQSALETLLGMTLNTRELTGEGRPS